MEKTLNRRNFFKFSALGLMTAPLLKSDLFAMACPANAPEGAIKAKYIDDKTAKRLKFVPNIAKPMEGDAKSVKKYAKWLKGKKAAKMAKKSPSFKPNLAACGNCNFYKAPKDGYGKCTMAANRYVPACGWCNSYAVDKKQFS